MKRLLCLIPAIVGLLLALTLPILFAKAARGMTLSGQVQVVAVAGVVGLIFLVFSVLITIGRLKNR